VLHHHKGVKTKEDVRSGSGRDIGVANGDGGEVMHDVASPSRRDEIWDLDTLRGVEGTSGNAACSRTGLLDELDTTHREELLDHRVGR